MDDIICKCGHSIDYHLVHGCQHTDDTDIKLWCQCVYSPQTVELNALRADNAALRQRVERVAKSLKETATEKPEIDGYLLINPEWLAELAAALLERK